VDRPIATWETIRFGFSNVIVRGHLYKSNDVKYLLGDVIEVELSNGYIIDVGWEEDEFLIVVYKEYWGNHFISLSAQNVEEVAFVVRQLYKEYIGR
jgi:hypothetical protein